MTVLIVLLSFILIACSTVTATYWIIVWSRVWIMLREKPTIREGLAVQQPDEASPRLSVIVPAHNEARVIDACCRGLRAQSYPDVEIIFVLDRCTDSTLEIVRQHAAADRRIRILENETCPDDWAGKCNAARRGTELATGEWLLFTDADTAFDPELCRAAVALARHRRLGLLSLLSDLTFEHHYERVAQPVAAMSLIRLYPLRRLGDRPVRPFANGQFMLFDRLWYERLGGHAAVKDDLLEDLALARELRDAGGTCATFLADGMLRCSMYDSLERFRNGWKRIFIEAWRRRPRRLRINGWRLIFSGIIGPIFLLASLVLSPIMWWTGDTPLAIGLGLASTIGALFMAMALDRIYQANGAPRRAVLYYPRGCLIVAGTMFEGANDLEARRPVHWGGKEYVLEPWE